MVANVTFDADTLYWIAAETVETACFGDAVAGLVVPAMTESNAVHTLVSGRPIFVGCMLGSSRAEFLRRWGA